jgi:hypothetical protein
VYLPYKKTGPQFNGAQIVQVAFGLGAVAPVLLPSLLGIVGYELFFPRLVIAMWLLLLSVTYINQRL